MNPRRVNQRRLHQLQHLRHQEYHHDQASWWWASPPWDYYLACFTTRGSVNHNHNNIEQDQQPGNESVVVRNEIHRHHPNVATATITTAATQQQEQQQQTHQQQQPLFAKKRAVVQGPSLDDLNHDVKIQTCVICLENAPICQAIPCMHKSYCVQCARILCFGPPDQHAGIGSTEIKKQYGELKCCVCRQDVHAIQRVVHS